MSIITDLSVNKKWVARKGDDNNFTISFIDVGLSQFDISGYVFSLQIYKYNNKSTPILSLTEGSGIINNGVTGSIDISITDVQSDAILADSYYYQIKVVFPDSYVHVLFQGEFELNAFNTDVSVSDGITATLNLSGSDVTATITISSVGGAGNHGDLILDDGTNPHGTTKTDVGLSLVDNTTDVGKPVSISQQAALDAQNLLINGGGSVTTSMVVTSPVGSAAIISLQNQSTLKQAYITIFDNIINLLAEGNGTVNNIRTKIDMNYNNLSLTYNNAANNKYIALGTALGITVSDTVNNIGFVYLADNSAAGKAYPLWIPPKGYNDSVYVSKPTPSALTDGATIAWDWQNKFLEMKTLTTATTAITLTLSNIIQGANQVISILKNTASDVVITLAGTGLTFYGYNNADLNTTPEITLSGATGEIFDVSFLARTTTEIGVSTGLNGD